MQFSKRSGQPIDHPDKQVIELPLALVTILEILLKDKKLYYKISTKKVSVFNIICCLREKPCKPGCVLMEGMFLINTIPLNSHKNLSDYTRFLMSRFIICEFKTGVREVHLTGFYTGF